MGLECMFASELVVLLRRGFPSETGINTREGALRLSLPLCCAS